MPNFIAFILKISLKKKKKKKAHSAAANVFNYYNNFGLSNHNASLQYVLHYEPSARMCNRVIVVVQSVCHASDFGYY